MNIQALECSGARHISNNLNLYGFGSPESALIQCIKEFTENGKIRHLLILIYHQKLSMPVNSQEVKFSAVTTLLIFLSKVLRLGF